MKVGPFFLENKKSDQGILLVHGYTANPRQAMRLGEYLYKEGHTVYGACIAGHGSSPEELRETNWQDWYLSVEKSYDFLKDRVKSVYGIGFSLGGLLLLHLAKQKPLAKIVTVGSPVWVKKKRAYLTRLFVPFTDMLHLKLGFDKYELTEEDRQIAYDKNPIRSVHQLLKFIDQAKKDLAKVTVPVLVLHSLVDDVAHPKSAEYIIEHIGSQEKTLKFMGREHIFVKDHDKAAYEKIAAFLRN